MYKISKYENCKNPNVSSEDSINKFLDTIKFGDPTYAPIINEARTYAKGHSKYVEIKEKELPTHRFNFRFNGYAKNKNIVEPTGLIYIDADDVEDIPDNDLIYAKWKSLSNTGYSVLVKVQDLTTANFSDTYDNISSRLNIVSDANARKANQQTVLSYDPNLFYNPDSITYSASTISFETKKVSNHTIKKREECIGRNDTFSNYDESIRFNNINDYFIDIETQYRVFTDKIMVCDPFIPRRIEKGKRDTTMFFLLSQYQLLNPSTGYNFLSSISRTINDKMFPQLSFNQVKKIINSVIKMHEGNELKWHFNSDRRILFNPKYKLTQKEIMSIVNKEMGQLRVKKSQQKIHNAIENWDFNNQGKIIQKKVAEITGLSIPTVRRHWSGFKIFVKELNIEFKSEFE